MALVRESPFDVGHYQQRSLEDYVQITSSLSLDGWIDHKCLVYWKSGLNAAQQHNITYNSESSNVLLESIDVLQVVGGTGYESSMSLTQGLTSIQNVNVDININYQSYHQPE